MQPMRIDGGTVLRDGALVADSIGIADGLIADRTAAGARVLDAAGLLVLPGIVDLHGDAFERQIQPRPGVAFPMDLALAETERQLLANGITTAFHGITLSWEPGLRSAATWRAMLDGLAARSWDCDMRVHLRWEAFNIDALDMACADIAAGRVHLLAFNDHTPAIMARLGDDAKASKYSERCGHVPGRVPRPGRTHGGARGGGPGGAATHRRGGPAGRLADGQPRRRQHRLPRRVPWAGRRHLRVSNGPGGRHRGAAGAGDSVAMGSPNVVRGGSHLGWASAARLAEADICTVLTSDYYYPCLLQAAFALAGRGVLDLPRAWALISTNPATAARLDDRGTITAGRRADLVLVDPSGPRLVATLAGGQVAQLAASDWGRLN